MLVLKESMRPAFSPLPLDPCTPVRAPNGSDQRCEGPCWALAWLEMGHKEQQPLSRRAEGPL